MFFSFSSGATWLGLRAAADDDVDLDAIGERTASRMSCSRSTVVIERQLALDDRHQRLERPVDGLVGTGLGIGARLVEQPRELVEPAVALPLRGRRRSLAVRRAAAAAAAAATPPPPPSAGN